MSQLPLSVAYIVKNEGLFLEESLASLGHWPRQIVVVDSGSTDSTLEIVGRFKKQFPQLILLSRDWTNDFAAARNFALHVCDQPWVLFIDGDEILDSSSEEILRSIVMRPASCDWYALIQRNYTHDSHFEAVTPCKLDEPIPYATNLRHKLAQAEEQNLYYFDNWMERLLYIGSERNKSLLRYEGRVHESLIPASERNNLKGERLSLLLHHWGRLKPGQGDKVQYYFSLSLQKLKDSRQDPAAWIELFMTANEIGKTSEMLPLIDEVLERFPQNTDILRIAFQILLRADQFQKAEAVLRRFLLMKPEDLYARGQVTTALLYQGRFEDFLSEAEQLVRDDPSHFVGHTNLAIYYFEKHDWKKAREHLIMAQCIKPFDDFIKVSLQKVDAELQKC